MIKRNFSASSKPGREGRGFFSKKRPWGFTLIELMIVIVIVAVLVGLALPSYKDYVRKARRGEAQQLLMNWANMQEIWRANHTTYAAAAASPDGIPAPTHSAYVFSLEAATATTYSLQAEPQGDQAKDKCDGYPYDELTLDQSNTKTPPDCW